MVSVCMYVFLQRQLSLRCETWYQIHFAVSACLSLRRCLSFFLYLCWSLPFLCHCLASHIWIKAESLGAAPHSFIHPLISVLWVRPCFRLDFCLSDVSRSPDLLFVLLFSCSRILVFSSLAGRREIALVMHMYAFLWRVVYCLFICFEHVRNACSWIFIPEEFVWINSWR